MLAGRGQQKPGEPHEHRVWWRARVGSCSQMHGVLGAGCAHGQWGELGVTSGASVEGISSRSQAVWLPLHDTCTSQSVTRLSQPPDASCLESGLKLTVSTLRW